MTEPTHATDAQPVTDRRRPSALSLTFLALVHVPLVTMALGLDPLPFPRPTAATPKLPDSPRAVLSLPGQIKDWYTENFGMRGPLVHLDAYLQTEVLKAAPSKDVFGGRDGWFFLAGEKAIEDYRRVYPFDPPTLRGWVEMLDARYQWCKARGIPYVFVLGPNKHSLYGAEYLPERMQPADRPSRFDQLLEALRARDPAWPIVDAREALRAATAERRVYHRTDTHWNPLGAYIAYAQMADELKKRYRLGLFAPPWRTLKIAERDEHGGDLSRMAGMWGWGEERIIAPELPPVDCRVESGEPLETGVVDIQAGIFRKTTCEGATHGRVVVFHDSFGEALVGYIARNFRHGRFEWSDRFDPAVVEEEKPDAVIQILVERRLHNRDPVPDELAAAGTVERDAPN